MIRKIVNEILLTKKQWSANYKIARDIKEIKMKIERAMEILDPEHRENYDSIDIVNEACRIGIEALKKQMPLKLIPPTEGECEISMCPNCREPIWSGDFRKYFGAEYNYCPRCGQALELEGE